MHERRASGVPRRRPCARQRKKPDLSGFRERGKSACRTPVQHYGSTAFKSLIANRGERINLIGSSAAGDGGVPLFTRGTTGSSPPARPIPAGPLRWRGRRRGGRAGGSGRGAASGE